MGKLIATFSRALTGVEIHPGARIGKGLFIDHGSGVVIGETVVIGEHCVLFHNVTLGGTGRYHGQRHPVVGDHVSSAPTRSSSARYGSATTPRSAPTRS